MGRCMICCRDRENCSLQKCLFAMEGWIKNGSEFLELAIVVSGPKVRGTIYTSERGIRISGLAFLGKNLLQ